MKQLEMAEDINYCFCSKKIAYKYIMISSVKFRVREIVEIGKKKIFDGVEGKLKTLEQSSQYNNSSSFFLAFNLFFLRILDLEFNSTDGSFSKRILKHLMFY